MTRDRSSLLHRRACELIPGGVNSPVRAAQAVGGEPVFIRSARGCQVTDVDGNTYTDWCMSWGPLILGHARSEVVDAVREAAGRGLSYGACHEREIELAELILAGFPTFDRVRLVSTGTEAVMTALRIARAVTGRPYVVKLEGGYHGHHDSMLVKAGSGLATQGIADSEGVPQALAALTLVIPMDDASAATKLFEEHGTRIAAVIVEPLPANNGLLPQRPEYLRLLRELTSSHGSLLVFDEVISGFRLRYGPYAGSLGIEADLYTLGKIVGGGMPVGAVVGRAEHMDRLAPLGRVYQAGTLSGNPVSLAAGIATLRILLKDPPYDRLERLGARLVEGLGASGSPHARAQRVGSVVWLHLDAAELPRCVRSISTRAMNRFKALYPGLLDAGHYLPPSSYEVLFLSVAHGEREIDSLARGVAAALEAEPK